MLDAHWTGPVFAAAGGAAAHPVAMLPFALLLACFAVMPFLHRTWWHHHYPKVSVGLGSITVAYYLFALGRGATMLHVAHEYAGFMALIGSLFVVAGGVHIRIQGQARPLFNCAFLFGGAVLANLVGTTGASMLLIRPWIRLNASRVRAFHIVFFIFLVSNVGGGLTPIGDPPLFLGYLKGVPFWWVLKNCWPAWLVTALALVAVFYGLDRASFSRAGGSGGVAARFTSGWKFEGTHNFAFLGLILVAVFLRNPVGVSEGLMVAAAIGSWITTSKSVHEANQFNFEPIREVAWLFAGIFATMVPVLDYLEVHAGELGLDTPLKFYWLTGLLSGVLDNAPTYVTFLAAAMGRQHLSIQVPDDVRLFALEHGPELVAISLGAVFFGAMTYIGNGPNFMVKAIAEHSRVETPNFFTYLFKYAVVILLPVLVLVSLLFFNH